MRCSPANIKIKDMAKFDAKKADLDKDGVLSDYERNRGEATAAAMPMAKGYKMAMGKDKSGMDSSHAFPMKQAYNIRMSPILQTENEEGESEMPPPPADDDAPENIDSKKGVDELGTLGNVLTETKEVYTPGSTKTNIRLSYADAWEQDLEGIRSLSTAGKGYDKLADSYNIDINDPQRAYKAYVMEREGALAADPEGEEALRAAATGVSGGPGTVTTTTPGTTTTETTETFTPETETVNPFGVYDQKRDTKRSVDAARNINKFTRKANRAENRATNFLERKGGVIDKDGNITGLSKSEEAKYKRLMEKSSSFNDVAQQQRDKLKLYNEQKRQNRSNNQDVLVDKKATESQQLAYTQMAPMQMKPMQFRKVSVSGMKPGRSGYKPGKSGYKK